MARFNDIVHIETLKRGVIPDIYVNIFKEVKEQITKVFMQDSTKKIKVIDLGSGTGILSFLVKQYADEINADIEVIAIDESKNNAEKAKTIGIDTVCSKINNVSLNAILSVLQGADIVIARRIMPELHSTDEKALRGIITSLLEQGSVIIGEARIYSPRTVHPLGSLKSETDYILQGSNRNAIIKGNIYII